MNVCMLLFPWIVKKSELLFAKRTTVWLGNWLWIHVSSFYVWIRYMIFFPFSMNQKWWWKGMYVFVVMLHTLWQYVCTYSYVLCRKILLAMQKNSALKSKSFCSFLVFCCTHCDKKFAPFIAEKFSWQCRSILLFKANHFVLFHYCCSFFLCSIFM